MDVFSIAGIPLYNGHIFNCILLPRGFTVKTLFFQVQFSSYVTFFTKRKRFLYSYLQIVFFLRSTLKWCNDYFWAYGNSSLTAVPLLRRRILNTHCISKRKNKFSFKTLGFTRDSNKVHGHTSIYRLAPLGYRVSSVSCPGNVEFVVLAVRGSCYIRANGDSEIFHHLCANTCIVLPRRENGTRRKPPAHNHKSDRGFVTACQCNVRLRPDCGNGIGGGGE